MDNLNLVKKLPPMLTGQELEKALTILPEYDPGIKNESTAARLIALSEMYKVFVPTQMSKEIYELMDDETFQIRNRDLIGMEKDVLDREVKEADRLIHIYLCAKNQEQVDEYRNDAELLQQKIEIAKDANKDLEPERKKLGGILKAHYEECIQTQQEQIDEKLSQMEENQQKQEEQKERNHKLQEECLRLRFLRWKRRSADFQR